VDTNPYTSIWLQVCRFNKKILLWKARDILRQKKPERAISGHFETLSDISGHLIQKKQARNIKGGKKTKDHTKKKFCTKLTEADEYLDMEAYEE